VFCFGVWCIFVVGVWVVGGLFFCVFWLVLVSGVVLVLLGFFRFGI